MNRLVREIQKVGDELKSLTKNQCDSIGCGDCPYKTENSCRAVKLQNDLDYLEKDSDYFYTTEGVKEL